MRACARARAREEPIYIRCAVVKVSKYLIRLANRHNEIHNGATTGVVDRRALAVKSRKPLEMLEKGGFGRGEG